jgi:dihydrofolate reductase
VSYDAWGNFHPDTNAGPDEHTIWNEVHSKHKVVFSRHPGKNDSATFISSDIAETVNGMKKQTGKDIWLYGGASLIKTFIREGLIDVYRISVHPTVLGSGKPLFEDLKERLELRLIQANTFKSGVVQLIYEPRK